MTEHITPELLAKMHAALRGVKYKGASKHLHKRKPSFLKSSMGNALNATPPVPGSFPTGAASAPRVDTSLAESVAQTTAESTVDMATEIPAVELSVDQAPAREGPPKEGGEELGPIMDTVLETEIEAVESSLLNPLLEQVAPPIQNGVFEIKDTQGKVIQRMPYTEGKIQGEVQLFDAQGIMVQTYTCVDGIKQGPMRYFDAAGHLTHEVPYVKDKREGMGTFYVNGIKTAEITFQADNMEGPAVYYAPEGYVSAAVLYHNNALEGEMRCFDAQQRLVKTFVYHKGELHGDSVTYYPGGLKIFEQMTYQQNVPVGKQVQFYENGSVLSLREYDKGKLVKEKYYDSKGKEISKPEGEKIINLFPHIPNFKKS